MTAKDERRRRRRERKRKKAEGRLDGEAGSPAPSNSAADSSLNRTESPANRNPWRVLRIVAAIFSAAIVVSGVYIYFPRSSAYFSPGIDVWADCEFPRGVIVGAQLSNTDHYALSFLFGKLKSMGCHRVHLRTPGPLVGVRARTTFSPTNLEARSADEQQAYLRSLDVLIPDGGLQVAERAGEVAVTVNVDAFSNPDLAALHLYLQDLRSESFETFRLLVAPGMKRAGMDNSLNPVTLKFNSVSISPDFNVTSVEPAPTFRRRQIGAELITFDDSVPLREINVVVVSKPRELLKNIFSLVVIATATSLLASWLYGRFSQPSEPSKGI